MKNVVEEDNKIASDNNDADISMTLGFRDSREEARRELEDERRRDQEVKAEWEGLRWRGFGSSSGSDRIDPNAGGIQNSSGRERDTRTWLRAPDSDGDMPGPMPGTLIL